MVHAGGLGIVGIHVDASADLIAFVKESVGTVNHHHVPKYFVPARQIVGPDAVGTA